VSCAETRAEVAKIATRSGIPTFENVAMAMLLLVWVGLRLPKW